MNVLQGTVDCRPEETGYDSSRLNVLHEHFKRLIDTEIIFGAQYTILHKGKIIANASLGRGSAFEQVDMKPDTVFKIASVTKPMTAVAIMQLVEAGLIRLDTRVAEVLPQFDKAPFQNIQIHHLLTHTSAISPDWGCFQEEGCPDAWDLIDIYAKAWDGEGEFDWVAAAISGGLHGEVGTRWQYSSIGFVILGEIITKVSGQYANDYLMEHIIKPLGMNETAFRPTVEMAKRAFPMGERDQKKLKDIMDGVPPRNADSFWAKIPSTGGGLWSTTRDLMKFSQMILNKGRLGDVRILGRKSVELMTTRQLHNIPDYCWNSNEPDRGYGLGFDMRQGHAHTYSPGTCMHEGWGTCSLDIDPSEDFAVAWFTPYDKVEWVPEPLYNAQAIMWSGLK